MVVTLAATAAFFAVQAAVPGLIGAGLAALGTSAAFNALAIAALPGIAAGAGLVAATYVGAVLRPARGPERITQPKSLATLQSPASPARYILGRARVRGAPVFVRVRTSGETYRVGGSTYAFEDDQLCMVIALAQGKIHHVDRLIIAGQEYEVSYSTNGQLAALAHRPDYLGRVEGESRRELIELRVWDGSQTTAASEITALLPEWDATKIGRGVAYCLLCIRQPGFQRYSRSAKQWVPIGEPKWQGMIYPEFEIRGLEITRPSGATTMTTGWTENAADIWYWLMTQRGGVPDSAIDRTAFLAARAVCEADAGGEKRYAAGGFLASLDDFRAVQDEVLFAMQGYAPIWNGRYFLSPGADTSPVRAIGEADLVSLDEVSPFPDLADRVNALTARCAQSRRHGYDEFAIPEIQDAAAQTRDGARLSRDLGRRAFVNSDSQLARLARNELAELRQWPLVRITVAPGAGFANFGVRPCDFITLDLPDEGLDAARCYVLSTRIDPQTMTAQMLVRVQAAGVYSDAPAADIEAPLPESALRFRVRGEPPPAPTGLAVAVSAEVTASGAARWRIACSIDPTLYAAQWELRGPVNGARRAPVETDFYVDALGEYTLTVYHVEDGLGSAEATREVNLGLNALAGVPLPPPPVITGTTTEGVILIAALESVSLAYVEGVEFRAARQSVTSTGTLPAPTEATWGSDDFTDLGRTPIVASADGRGANAILIIPLTGRYRVFARYVDRWDRRGPIAEVTTAVFLVPASAVINAEDYPLWPGTRRTMGLWGREQNLLVDRDGDLGDIPFSAWDGAEGYPFGEARDAAAQPYFQPPDLDLGANKAIVELESNVLFFTPAGLSPDVDITHLFQARRDGSSSWVTIDSERERGDGATWSHVAVAQGGSGYRYFRVRITMNDASENVGLARWGRTFRVVRES